MITTHFLVFGILSSVTISPPLLPSGTVFYGPTVTIGAAHVLSPPLLTSTTAFFPPHIGWPAVDTIKRVVDLRR